MKKMLPGVGPKHPQVVTLVGATGGLSQRKLLCRACSTWSAAAFISGCRIVGMSLDDLDADGFRILARKALDQFSMQKVNEADWAAFAENLD